MDFKEISDALIKTETVVEPVVEAVKAETKPWYQSKIIWTQVVSALLELGNMYGSYVPPGTPSIVFNVLTVLLRFTSTTVLKG